MSDDTKNEVDNRPTSQIDLERRLEQDHLPESVRVDNTKDDVRNPEVTVAQYQVDGNDTSGYRGVSPEYMTYADERDKPMTADEGPEAEAQKRLELGVAGVRKSVDLSSPPTTEVGVGNYETLNTAVSGEGYSAKLVDAAPDFQGTPSADVPFAGSDESAPVDSAAVAGKPSTAPKAAKATAAKSNS